MRWFDGDEELVAEMNRLRHRLNDLEERMYELSTSQGATQAQVDADTALLQQVQTDLQTSISSIQAEMTTLRTNQANGAALDLSNLESQITALDGAAKAVGSLTPAAPAPAAPAAPAAPTGP